MPTEDQMTELRDNCKREWTTRNGVKGRLFTSKKNGATLFLPAAGYYHVSDLNYAGVGGDYWLRSLGTDYQYHGWRLLFGSNYCEVDRNHDRCYGFCVRPVREKPRPMNEETENPSKYGNSQMYSSGGTAGGKESSTISNTNVRTSGSANGHDYVDLGLPSGTLWATCNVGASSPEDNGSYFAWGETSTKGTYDWNTYKYANGDYKKITKYCNRNDRGNNGFTDNLTELQTIDDAAMSNLGSGWRIPSKAQWDELKNNTTHKWTTRNGKTGRLFTSKKNGQSIFLPAAGYRWGSEYSGSSSYGGYQSRSLRTDVYPNSAWGLNFHSDDCYMGGVDRSSGFSVRPVREISKPTAGGSGNHKATSGNGGSTGGDNGSSTSSTNVSISGSANGHDYVDLGLPSGTKWATCNVGASKPEDYGSYFAWGETQTKMNYNWETYKYANGNLYELTKYCPRADFGNKGFYDDLTSLISSDDPSVVIWGDGWRTPTYEQLEELFENTTNQWTTKNGVNGRLFTSKKNGKTLFIPASGYRDEDKLRTVGVEGNYWTMQIVSDFPRGGVAFCFSSDTPRGMGPVKYGTMSLRARCSGLSVRPVRAK